MVLFSGCRDQAVIPAGFFVDEATPGQPTGAEKRKSSILFADIGAFDLMYAGESILSVGIPSDPPRPKMVQRLNKGGDHVP
jgi:hypothetical protein